MIYVYILQSYKDGTFYTGATEDLRGRLKQHNSKNTRSTVNKAPFKIAWFCAFQDKGKAYQFE